MSKWIYYAVGYVFVTSGIAKLVVGDFKTMFANLGIPFPAASLFIIALLELGCGMLLAGNMFVKYALIPLIIIICGAILITKLPILFSNGILDFAFQSRLDFVLLILLLLLWRHSLVKHNSST